VVALLVRLKLTLFRNSLRRSLWRTVGLIIGMVYGLGLVVMAIAGLVVLRFTSASLTADVTVLTFSLLTLGWLLMSLLVFGIDETVDPSKFALLPVSARQLLPGLVLAGLISIPGVATVLISAGLVVSWARTLPLTLAAVIAVPLGIATCFLLSRTATSAFASFLASRRFRDLAVVLLALIGAGLAIGGNLLGSLAERGLFEMRTVLSNIARVAGWTPFGWAWSIPADIARGQWLVAGTHLLLASSLVLFLWLAWEHFLGARLVEPIAGGKGSTKVRKGGCLVDRLLPATAAGSIASRALHYWRRDPRYLGGLAGFLIAPIVIILSQLLNPSAGGSLAMLAPSLIAALIGMIVAQDLSYDGTAIWLHITTGVSGRDDRLGRVLAVLVVFGPLVVILIAVAATLVGRWDMLIMVSGLTAGLMLTGLGVGALIGSLWQWPAPPPGANPFQRSSSGGLPSLLSLSASTFGTLIASLPVIIPAVLWIWWPWVGYLTPPIGIAWGLLALRIGIRKGGKVLDRRWPEVMVAVSERTA
jgi:ABC-2 type transport system permease protein